MYKYIIYNMNAVSGCWNSTAGIGRSAIIMTINKIKSSPGLTDRASTARLVYTYMVRYIPKSTLHCTAVACSMMIQLMRNRSGKYHQPFRRPPRRRRVSTRCEKNSHKSNSNNDNNIVIFVLRCNKFTVDMTYRVTINRVNGL